MGKDYRHGKFKKTKDRKYWVNKNGRYYDPCCHDFSCVNCQHKKAWRERGQQEEDDEETTESGK